MGRASNGPALFTIWQIASVIINPRAQEARSIGLNMFLAIGSEGSAKIRNQRLKKRLSSYLSLKFLYRTYQVTGGMILGIAHDSNPAAV